MKMEVLQSSKTLKKIVVTGCLFTVFLLCMCNQSNSKADIGYGKSLYSEKCLSCHSYTTSSSIEAITLMTMNSYDSLLLLDKLRNLKKDDIHSGQLQNVSFTEKEILSLSGYIRDYFKSHY